MKRSHYLSALAIAFAASSIFSGCAARSNFNVADDNSDGKLSYDEVERALLTAIFDKGDPNGDGKISFDEVTAAAPTYPRARFNQRDGNGDGFVTPAELDEFAAENDNFGTLIASMDADNDGFVDRAEADAFNARLMAAPGDSTLEKLYYLNESLKGK